MHMGTVTANDDPTDGSDAPPANPEQHGDHAERHTEEVVNEERTARVDQHDEVINHESVSGVETNKDAMDEIGEEVVEAGEDMVIY